jgi:hypothetical protein
MLVSFCILASPYPLASVAAVVFQRCARRRDRWVSSLRHSVDSVAVAEARAFGNERLIRGSIDEDRLGHFLEKGRNSKDTAGLSCSSCLGQCDCFLTAPESSTDQLFPNCTTVSRTQMLRVESFTHIFHAQELITAIVANWTSVREHALERGRYRRVRVFFSRGQAYCRGRGIL